MATTFQFAHGNSASLGFIVEKRSAPVSVEIRKTIHKVAGRDDDIFEDENCLNNITLEYQVGSKNIDYSIQMINKMLNEYRGYQKLIDSNYPDGYRRAFVSNQVKFTEDLKNFGHAALQFSADPWFYLNSGDTETTVTTSGVTLQNPDDFFTAKPLIVAQGTAGSTVTLHIMSRSYAFTIPPGGKITIDCLNQTAYTDTANACRYLNFEEFPYLDARSSISVSRTGGTSLKITPRWRRL